MGFNIEGFEKWLKREMKRMWREDVKMLEDLGPITLSMNDGATISNNEIYVGGQKIQTLPGGMNNVSIINNRVYVDGYEYKNGTWKKTFAAWWHKYF